MPPKPKMVYFGILNLWSKQKFLFFFPIFSFGPCAVWSYVSSETPSQEAHGKLGRGTSGGKRCFHENKA
jgi:hypothetical protein